MKSSLEVLSFLFYREEVSRGKLSNLVKASEHAKSVLNQQQ